MNYVRLLERLGDIAAAVGEGAEEQARICRSAVRLSNAGQMEDAQLLMARAHGISEANERVMAVIKEIAREMDQGG